MKKFLLSLLCLLTAIAGYAAKTAKAVVSADEKTLTFYYDEKDHSSEGTSFALNEGENYPDWYDYMGTVTTAVFDESFRDARPTTTYMWFGYQEFDQETYRFIYSALTEIKGIENLNTSEVTNMGGMFFYCTALTSLDLSNFNTAKVTNMFSMFQGCKYLKSIDLSSFNTAKVTNMGNMFSDCENLKSLDLSSFNTENVTNMNGMFNNCIALETLDLSSFNTENVTYISYMFANCRALTTIYASENFVTTKAEYYDNMFTDCTSLVGGAGTTYSSTHTDATYAKVDNGENDPGYFTCKPKTAKAVVSADETTLTFYYDNLSHSSEGTSFALNEGSDNPGWYDYMRTVTTAVFDASFKDARPTTTYSWFDYNEWDFETYEIINSALTEIRNIEYLNTSEVTNMGYMFAYCTSLKSIDLSNFDTGKVTDMGYMFAYCTSLKSIDLSSFNTENVTYMNSMFENCKALTSLDLSSFNTAKVTDMNSMFDNCTSLKSIDLSSFNTENVTYINSMFDGCEALESLDLSSFNTANVTDMSYMFRYCENLKSLDLSSFNTENVTDIGSMFDGCNVLLTIFASEDFVTTNVTSYPDMFTDCTSLVGGAGTTFNSSYTDVTYAKVDGGTGNPGYFTYKAAPIKLTIDESGYATFCSTKAVDFSDQTDFKAYIVSGYNKSTKTTTLTQVNDAPAGTGILVIGTPGTYTLTEATSAGIYSNFLVGVTEATTLAQTDGSNTNFVLADGSEGYAFYKVDDDGGELAAGKAYLSLPTSAVAGAKTFRFAFDEETTAVSGISADDNASKAIYNLAGQKVDDSYKGIVIKNGKKIMKK